MGSLDFTSSPPPGFIQTPNITNKNQTTPNSTNKIQTLVDSPVLGSPPGFSKRNGISRSHAKVFTTGRPINYFEDKNHRKSIAEGVIAASGVRDHSVKSISTIFIGNLSRRITELKLQICCSSFGKVEAIRIFRKVNGGVFSFVRFRMSDEAIDVISRLNNKWIMDRKVGVDWAKYDIRPFYRKPLDSLAFNQPYEKKLERSVVLEINGVYKKEFSCCIRLISKRFWNFRELFDKLTELK